MIYNNCSDIVKHEYLVSKIKEERRGGGGSNVSAEREAYFLKKIQVAAGGRQGERTRTYFHRRTNE
jgi:hypothetical protein